MNIDVESIKRSVNIIGVISSTVQLKKAGKNYHGLCPFHSEKTPSFTVNESKQMYYCFGCGASGDVIRFVMDYSNCDFVDACESLSGAILRTPKSEVKKNIERAKLMIDYSTPVSHRQDSEKSIAFVGKCNVIQGEHLKYYDKDGQKYLPVISYSKQLVNIAKISDPITFLAGGVSYGCFTPIRKDSPKICAVTDLFVGIKIASKFNISVLVCYDTHNLKYVCDIAKPKNINVFPVLTSEDDDAVALDLECFFFDGEKIKKWGDK